MDIKVQGTPEYERSITELLTTIKKNPVGGIIVGSIEGLSSSLTIVPYHGGKAAIYGDCNAATIPDSAEDSAPVGIRGDLPGESGWYKGDPDDPRTARDERDNRMPPGKKGTGAGSSVQIFFSPDKSGSCGGGRYGSLPDEVLFHEMVHALRMMQGKSNHIPTQDNLRRYDNEEEFLAIVVANVYMSANNKKELRADHWGHSQLKAPLDTSAGFLTDAGNLKLMNIYKLIWQPTFFFLGQHVLNLRFNPFRAMYGAR